MPTQMAPVVLQNQTASISLANGRAAYTTTPGKDFTLRPASIAYSTSLTGASCITFSFEATSPLTVFLSSLADLEDTFDPLKVSLTHLCFDSGFACPL